MAFSVSLSVLIVWGRVERIWHVNCSQQISYAERNITALISILCSQKLTREFKGWHNQKFLSRTIYRLYCNLQWTSDDQQKEQTGSQNYEMLCTSSIQSYNDMHIYSWSAWCWRHLPLLSHQFVALKTFRAWINLHCSAR